jgi:hypothetical protein
MENLAQKIEFRGGLIFFHSLQFMFFPINSFLCVLNEINEKEENKEKIIKIFRTSSYIDSEIISREIINSGIPDSMLIEEFLNKINSLGFGKVELEFIKKDYISFVLTNLTMTNNYTELFKKKPKVFPEEIIVGYLEKFIEILYKKRIKSKIINSGHNFILNIGIEILNEEKPYKKSKFYYDTKSEEGSSEVVNQVVIGEHINIKDGILTMWGTFGIFVPYFFLIELTSKLGKNYNKFFEALGRMQGRCAVSLQKDMFGVEKEKLLRQVLEQSDLVGFGKIEIIKENPLKYKLKNNLETFFNYFYKSNHYENIRIFINNDFKGIYDFLCEKMTKIFFSKEIYSLKILKKTPDLSQKERELYKYIEPKSIVVTKI